MNDAFSLTIDRVRTFIAQSSVASSKGPEQEAEFNALALDLYNLQLSSVPAYRQFCDRRGTAPPVHNWHCIPALPISAFKLTEVTSLAPPERAHDFHSSGTTSESRSRHYHDVLSLGLYETALISGFTLQVRSLSARARFVSLTPPASTAPHSSLVYMLEALCRKFGNDASCFLGSVDFAGNWQVEPEIVLPALAECARDATAVVLVGTAFNLIHVLDHLAANNERLVLPVNSRVMETGGYKGRARALSRLDLYQRIHEFLGVPASQIVSEYGMCELSSQAYDDGGVAPRAFRFPPWARFRVVSPEDRRILPAGEPGILQIFDLANVRSVLAIQTEDLAVSGPHGFELLGRVTDAQPRGCSLMTA
jgi:hypothetical protein